MKKITAAVMTVLILLSFTASCKKSEPTPPAIVGVWRYELSFDEMSDLVGKSSDEYIDLAYEYADFTDAKFTVYLSFSDDGVFEQRGDYDSIFEAYNKAFADFSEYIKNDREALVELFSLRVSGEVIEVDYDTLLSMQVCSDDDFALACKALYMNEQTVTLAAEEAINSISEKTVYTLDDTRVYLSNGKKRHFDFERDKKDIKITSADSANAHLVGKKLTVTDKMPAERKTESTKDHTELYIDGCSFKDAYEYFCEVVLSSEYLGSEHSDRVQKWILPIYYELSGDYTDTDEEKIAHLAEKLNEVRGFPGMYPANDHYANMTISFYSSAELMRRMGSAVNNEKSDGIARYWYLLDSDVIYEAEIGCDKGISQQNRNSVLLEEILNAIGFSNDTELREDSVIYQGYTDRQHLSETDWLLVKLLYHPSIKAGMTKAECYGVIGELYN